MSKIAARCTHGPSTVALAGSVQLEPGFLQQQLLLRLQRRHLH